MYNLLVEGIRDLSRYTSLLQQRKVSHDSLSGIVDGSNKTFYTQFSPVLTSGSLIAYVSGSPVVVDSTDYDTGTIVLSGIPSKQPDATYTYTPFTVSQRVSMLMSGFDEMQSRWVRSDWYASSGSVAPVVTPTEDDTNIFIVQLTSSGSLIDPQCSGPVPFSELRTQIRFYMACCEYSYLARQLTENALTGISFRERAGAQIDRTRIVPNLKMALDTAESNAVRTMRAAWDQYYVNGEQYGTAIPPEHSVGYETQYNWHGEEEYPIVSDGDLRWL
jgi:hypothetical protein